MRHMFFFVRAVQYIVTAIAFEDMKVPLMSANYYCVIFTYISDSLRSPVRFSLHFYLLNTCTRPRHRRQAKLLLSRQTFSFSNTMRICKRIISFNLHYIVIMGTSEGKQTTCVVFYWYLKSWVLWGLCFIKAPCIRLYHISAFYWE